LIREATIDDLESVVALTKASRAQRARLHGDYWPPTTAADEMHAQYLESMLRNPHLKKLALEKDGRVIGFAAVQPRPSFSFIDDICLAEDADWRTDGIEILKAIEERPAITTVAHGNAALVEAAFEIGLTLVSTHRLFRLGGFEPLHVECSRTIPTDLIEPPLHVFIPLMDPQQIAIVAGKDGAYAVCSQSVVPPPILDIGGTAGVVDRIVGEDRRTILKGALSSLQNRGDVRAILIVAAEDRELSLIADGLGASHPVDVLKWPDM
jgi:hypothetical protein